MLGIIEKYEAADERQADHASMAFPTHVLREIEPLLSACAVSAETGCGKSTILFSNYSRNHFVFALDDTHLGNSSSVNFYREHALTKMENVHEVFGPTQRTVPAFEFGAKLDLVLIDGPHGYPFPELEYLAFYPHLHEGALLIVDDVCIPTISRLADFIAEDKMFDLVAVFYDNTAVFRRTNAPTFNPVGDGWWAQDYNRRRVSSKREFFLASDEAPVDSFSTQRFDLKLHG
jgi:hypothetical protein